MRAISARHIVLALAFTAASFLCLTLSDALAVRYTGKRLGYRRVALASFTSVSIGHLLGFAALSSGALRYRFYSRWGLTHGDVGRVLLFCGVTATVGMVTLGGLTCLVQPDALAELVGLRLGPVRAIGLLLIGAVAAYLAVAALGPGSLTIRRFELPVPPLRLALGQVAVGTADMLFVSAVLHQLLSAGASVPFVATAAAYVSANAAAVVAHVPGGLGVIEVVVVSLASGAHVIGALVAFRAIYYLLPFATGCAVLLGFEVVVRRRRQSAE